MGSEIKSDITSSTFRKTAGAISWNRREFIRSAASLGTGAAVFGLSPAKAAAQLRKRYKQKVVIVVFGGGARDEETFAPGGQQNIPGILHTLIPQATFYTQVVNAGILGHYVATSSMATGVYETFDNFAMTPPPDPTVFEYFRKGLHRPSSDAWVVAPCNGFNLIGQSDNRHYGSGYGAGVILPKHLLKLAMDKHGLGNYTRFIQDNYEDPFYTPPLGGTPFDLHQLDQILRVSVTDFVKHALTLSSPDELSVYIAKQLMHRLAPSLLWVVLHDMDIAHSGSFSLYVEGIRRSDRLCVELWKAIQENPEYSGRTTMFILPDFGRDSDISPAGNGFQNHRTGDALSRTTWLMALGPHIRQGIVENRPINSLDLVPTLGALMGFPTPFAKGSVLHEVI